jgi:hypothetical protein
VPQTKTLDTRLCGADQCEQRRFSTTCSTAVRGGRQGKPTKRNAKLDDLFDAI